MLVPVFQHAVIPTQLSLSYCHICEVDVEFQVQRNCGTHSLLTDSTVLFLELRTVFLKLYPDLSLYTLPEGKKIRLINTGTEDDCTVRVRLFRKLKATALYLVNHSHWHEKEMHKHFLRLESFELNLYSWLSFTKHKFTLGRLKHIYKVFMETLFLKKQPNNPNKNKPQQIHHQNNSHVL